MNNTLVDGDKVLVSYYSSDISRNKVIIFSHNNSTYVKRCIGLPGDTLQIFHGQVFVNGKLTNYLPGVISNPMLNDKHNGNYNVQIYDYYNSYWTMDDFGPYIIPKKNKTIDFKKYGVENYSSLIKIEAGQKYLDKLLDKTISFYTFKRDCFFVLGDNRSGSSDSRVFGPIVKDEIVGKVLLILYSSNQMTNLKRVLRTVN